MPPKSARKGPGPRKGAGRGGRKAAEVEAAPADVEEVKEEVKVVDLNVSVEEDKADEVDSGVKGRESVDLENAIAGREDFKLSYEEEYKDEILDLEGNEPEYEHEEETAVDYDDKDIVSGPCHEEVEYGVEEGRQEGDVDEHDFEDVGEEVEHEDYDENSEEVHEIDVEEEEQHDVLKEHRKRKEFEIFVGGLNKDATEDDLRKVFSQVGEIIEIRLMRNPLTNKNKGFAFVRFATVEQAKRAIAELKSPVIRDKQCGVAPVQDSDTLFLGNICKTWTKEHLKEKLKSYGVKNMEDLTLVEDTNNEGMNRGFAFLEFSSRSEATDAYTLLQRRDILFGVDRTAKVAFADSFIDPDDEIMKQVTTVFIDGLPSAWDEDRVKHRLKRYGVIVKIELARNMPSAKRTDFGFVTFDTHESAVACAEGINNSDFGDGDYKVKVRARLSRPHQKGRVRRSLRGNFQVGRGAPRGGYMPYRHPPRRYVGRDPRPLASHRAPTGSGVRRPLGSRERRPVMSMAEKPRRLPPPEHSYVGRPPIPPRDSIRRDYVRRDEIPPPRSRVPPEYNSRAPPERHASYQDEYPSRRLAYSTIPPRETPRGMDRRDYPDDTYGRKIERPLPSYRGHNQEYDFAPGLKRHYEELDDARYNDVSIRQSRARLDYDVGGGSSSSARYADPYGDRLAQSHVGYGGSGTSLSSQDVMYGGRQSMRHVEGSMRGNDMRGMYSPGYNNSYPSRGSDVGGSTYSSLYSGRNSKGNGYMGGSSGSNSYY